MVRVSALAMAMVLAAGLVAGCSPLGEPPVGPGKDLIIKSLGAMGGADAWSDIGKLAGTAVVTRYGADGRADVAQEKHVINVHGKTISAVIATDPVLWEATARVDGSDKFKALDQVTAAEKRFILNTLLITLQGIRGPMEFYPGKTAGAAVREIIHGKSVVGTKISDDCGTMYYFDPETSLLYCIARPGKAGQAGLAMVIEKWQKIGGIVSVPRRIETYHYGELVTVGARRVLTVEYQDMEIVPGLLDSIIFWD